MQHRQVTGIDEVWLMPASLSRRAAVEIPSRGICQELAGRKLLVARDPEKVAIVDTPERRRIKLIVASAIFAIGLLAVCQGCVFWRSLDRSSSPLEHLR